MDNRKNLLKVIAWIFVGLGLLKLADIVDPISWTHHGVLTVSVICFLLGARKLRSAKTSVTKTAETDSQLN